MYAAALLMVLTASTLAALQRQPAAAFSLLSLSPPGDQQPPQTPATRQHCARHAVPPPPPLPADKAAAGADAAAVLARVPVVQAYATNATFAAFMRSLTREQRERVAFESHSVALYLGDEVPELKAAEEAAALAAAPLRALESLNGLNVGAGGRPVHEALLLVDAHRGFGDARQELPDSQKAPVQTFLSWADRLPFVPGEGALSGAGPRMHAWRLHAVACGCLLHA